MISKIHIQNIATINDLTIEPLRINYIFGGNGSGKTTISKFLSSEANYQNGSILRDDTHDILVYNKDFVDKLIYYFIIVFMSYNIKVMFKYTPHCITY